jgi:hypothetical protein
VGSPEPTIQRGLGIKPLQSRNPQQLAEEHTLTNKPALSIAGHSERLSAKQNHYPFYCPEQ